MKQPTFESTIDILVKAYLNDTLEGGNPCGCAVGNLIAHALNIKLYVKRPNTPSSLGWDHPKYDGSHWYYDFNDRQFLIESTGYSEADIWRIERAFESHRAICMAPTDDSNFNGLMAVVDVLAEIHNVDLSIRDDAKLLFVKH